MKKLVLRFLGTYQEYRALRLGACRFQPTCTGYAYEAVERHGVGRGAWLAFRRVLRCHPLGGSGHDPVPDVQVQPAHGLPTTISPASMMNAAPVKNLPVKNVPVPEARVRVAR